MTLNLQKNIIYVPGIGLAAPQVDVSKRIFALHITEMKGEPISFVAINPKIVSHSVEKTYLTSGEGCLSVDSKSKGLFHAIHELLLKRSTRMAMNLKKGLKDLLQLHFNTNSTI